MTLLEQMYRQRVRFLQQNYREPNRLLVPYALWHAFLGEVWERYGPPGSTEVMHVNNMKVVKTQDVAQLECALVL